MSDKVQCSTHGEASQAFVCTHLIGDTFGLGFNSATPTSADPYPDAWCNDCEIIRKTSGGWNDESDKLAQIQLLCSGCYRRTRARNTIPEVTLDGLEDLRWKCSSCEEWHYGPALDFSYDSPHYWTDSFDKAQRKNELRPSWNEDSAPTFLNEDYCVIDREDFFVRGLIRLPIIGTDEHLVWGVWGSLSQQDWKLLRALDESGDLEKPDPMFSWLSNSISEYPETLSLKMYAHIRGENERPWFELEDTDHPLSREYYDGISPARVKEIMFNRLRSS